MEARGSARAEEYRRGEEKRETKTLEQEKEILVSGTVCMPSPIVKPHRHMANHD